MITNKRRRCLGCESETNFAPYESFTFLKVSNVNRPISEKQI